MDENKDQYFYCYSQRLYLFLKSLGFRWKYRGIHERTNLEMHVYEKTDKFMDAYALYQEVKNKYR